MKQTDARTESYVLHSRGIALDCRPERQAPPHVMGILNVTPDSFYDGGRFLAPDKALEQAEQMIRSGARLIDVGGASSRPRGSVYGEGAEPVDADEEIRRTVPVIEAVSAAFPNVWITVDTYLPNVAREALAAGAHAVNDITGLRLHPELAEVAARAGAPIIVMHSVGRPGEMPHTLDYGDVVDDVLASLAQSVRAAEESGVTGIVVDPGFGFGKTAAGNLRLIGQLDRFHELGRPILVGISRKSTIGSILGGEAGPVPPEERLFGTLGATAVAALRGAAIVRAHDVAATVQTLRLFHETLHA